MEYWLKALGFGAREHRLRDDWKNELGGLLVSQATFPKHQKPSGMRTGDAIVYYATGYGVVFAAGTVTSLAFLDPKDESDWPYRIRVSLNHALEFVHDGEPLENISDERPIRLSVRQKSHIRLSEAEYNEALRALKARGASRAR